MNLLSRTRRLSATTPGPALFALWLLVLAAAPSPLAAQGVCLYPYFWGPTPGYLPRANNCFGPSGFRCYQGSAGSPYFRLKTPTCDPQVQACTVELRVPLEFPGLEDMIAEDGLSSSPTPKIFWFDQPTAPPCPGSNPDCGQVAICGTPGFGGRINSDFTETWIERAGVTCANAASQTGDYSVRAMVCLTACRPPDTVVNGLVFGGPPLAAAIGCGVPRKWSCPEPAPNTCPLCKPGGVSAGGGGPGLGGGGADGPPLGDGATLRYAAGGVGGTGFPGTAEWTPTLGRYWSHDYAQRIVIDPGTGNDSHVWLLTDYATLREFTELSAGVYLTASPADEYRRLHRTATGWELHELNGTLHGFDAAGRWTGLTDRNGNAKVAAYDGSGRLVEVSFPDGRREEFSYHPGGKLAAIVVWGVGDAASRQWSYTWSGDDLARVDRPDGTAVEFFYGDVRHPGYLTRMELVGIDASRRVERAWAYDDAANVVDAWKGDASPTGPGAADRWQFAFDDPLLPAVATVTDPLGDDATLTLGRDPGSGKPKLLELAGDCPTCGMSPNAVLAYGDPSHPLLPTLITDAAGTSTAYEYDANGRLVSRMEALATPLERTSEWDYSAAYPALLTQVRQPSTAGGAAQRVTTYVRDGEGNVTIERSEGFEGGQPFLHETHFTYNAAGQVSTVDRPGHGSQDLVSFAYDPARGDLVLLSRSDPLIGTTSFAYDPFNRRTSETDPNAVVTETAYDALDRVTQVIRRGATPSEDLVTNHAYNALGDLFRTTLPRGNLVEYGYDAAGRLVALERKPDASTFGERMLFVRDGAGNVTREDLQRRDGPSWGSESFTEYVYTSRCRLDRLVHADGSETEYDYDCNGNLAEVWDANHDPATDPPTQAYDHDALDRPIAFSQPWGGAGGGSAVSTFEYDVQDHLVAVTDAEGNATSYVWSDRDLQTTMVSPASGTSTMAYDERGRLASSTDARGVTATHSYDALDRPTAVTYPDPALDVAYAYDDPVVPFSKGRLTAITRDGSAVVYRYDRFGRVTRDGGLTFAYDKNGNRTRIGQPYGAPVADAVYAFDFADREASLTLDPASGPDQPVVLSAAYEPVGPLAQLAFANGLTEARAHDSRYFPARLTLGNAGGDLLDWIYAVDGVGNVEAITDALDPEGNRAFAYQDVQYFLTQGDGPWGALAWTYDRIGNRLSETRDGSPTVYTYQANGAGGHTPRLAAVGPLAYGYDAAGNVTSIGSLPLTYDVAGRLSYLGPIPDHRVDIRYDGRGFLRSSEHRQDKTYIDWWIAPAYDSAGQLRFLHRQANPQGPFDNSNYYDVLYFAGRPVAVRRTSWWWGGPELAFYTTDHLGTPVLVTDAAGAVVFGDAFEPFGADGKEAADEDLFLRLPGQWADESWEGLGPVKALYYNLFRWYQPGTGRYIRPDPLGLLDPMDVDDSYFNQYEYAVQNPLFNADPTGLITLPPDASRRCRRRWINRILPQLQNPTNDCRDFFCQQLNTDLEALLDDPFPLIELRAGLGASYQCATADVAGDSTVIRVGRRSFCGSTTQAKHVVLHELGHYADCVNNGNRFPGGNEGDGCAAEVACFGFSVGDNCRALGFASR